MLPLVAIAKHEFAGVFKERTILLAVFIQVFVAGFSSLLVVGLSALADPDAIPAGAEPELVTDAPSDLSRLLEADGLTVHVAGDRESAMARFAAGEADAVFFVTDTGDPADPVEVELTLPDGDMFATLTLVQMKQILEDYERDLRTARESRLVHEPLYVDADVEGGQYAFVYALLIPLLVALPIILSGGLMADSITEEIQRRTLPLLLVSPATVSDVVGGKLLANTAIAPMLTAAWLGLLRLNGFQMPLLNVLLILVLATAIAFLAGLLACFIALLTRDRDRAQVLYAVVFFLVGGLSLLLPVSPVNALALLAADSAHRGVHLVVLGSVGLCLVGWLALHLGLARRSTHLAAVHA